MTQLMLRPYSPSVNKAAMSRWSLALALGLACADDGVRLGTTTPRWRDAAPTEPLARRRYFANGSFELARDEWLFDLRCARCVRCSCAACARNSMV